MAFCKSVKYTSQIVPIYYLPLTLHRIVKKLKNMKRLVFLFFMFALFSQIDVRAGITEEDPIEKKGDGNTGGPKSVLPVISTSIFEDLLTVSVRNYVGQVQVMVYSPCGENSCYQTYYIYGMDNINMDFSGFLSGCYTVSLRLQNGDVYTGVIRKD